jgi:hypothetical protein
MHLDSTHRVIGDNTNMTILFWPKAVPFEIAPIDDKSIS